MSKAKYIICDEKYEIIACGTYDQIDNVFGLAANNGDVEYELTVLKDFVKTQKLFQNSTLRLFVEAN